MGYGQSFYFASRHENKLPSGWLAHENIENYLVSLGSWHTSRPIFAYKESHTNKNKSDNEVIEGTNPETGKARTDYNLGANTKVKSTTDSQTGYMFQWCRPADEHQLRISPRTYMLSLSDQHDHGFFITSNTSTRGDFIQGNIYQDNFRECWENRYREYRDRRWMKTNLCEECPDFALCNGGSLHLRTSKNELINCHHMKFC